MAKKETKQKELELEDNEKAEDSNAQEEIVVIGEDNKEKVEKKQDDEVDTRIKELQDQIKNANADRQAALDRANKLEKDKQESDAKVQKAEGRAASTHRDSIIQALDAAQKEQKAQQAAMKAAAEGADSDKLVEAQTALSEATYLVAEIKKNKAAFEVWEKQQEELAKQPKVQELPQSVKDWIGRNPEYNSDKEFKDEADTAHDAAIRKGYGFGTHAYFDFIDKRLEKVGVKKSTEDEDETVVVEKPKKTYAAPPSRGTTVETESRSQNNGRKTYKLTAEQVEHAEMMNMTPLEYAQFAEKEKERK